MAIAAMIAVAIEPGIYIDADIEPAGRSWGLMKIGIVRIVRRGAETRIEAGDGGFGRRRYRKRGTEQEGGKQRFHPPIEGRRGDAVKGVRQTR